MARICVCVVLLSLLVGCATTAGYSRLPPSDVVVDSTARGEFTAGNTQPRGGLKEAPLERADLRIERAGWINVDTRNEADAAQKLRRMAAQFDATVMAFSTHSITFKMPSLRLEALLEVIGQVEGWSIDEFDFSALDRTGEYYSIEDRLESTQAVKARLLQLLEAAATLDEVLKIHTKLEDVQKQLDNLKGTLRNIELTAGRVDVQITFS